jgi:uncharacterized protein
MTRLLFWIAFIVLVVMAIRSKLRAAGARSYHPQAGTGQGAPASGPSHSRIEESERMSCCAHCGVYFPSSEAVHEGGRDYCSLAHARVTAASRPD